MEAGLGEIMYSPPCPAKKRERKKNRILNSHYKEWDGSTCIINMVGRT